LILFPDEDLQCDLEPLLLQADFDRSDEQHIVRGLMDEHLTPVFHFSDREGNVAVPLTEDAARAFLRRLNIVRNLDPQVVEAIEATVEGKIQNRIKVRLRNSRFSRTEGKAAFLCLFFRKLNRDDVFSHLDFMLEFFDETPEDVDIQASLFLKKRRLHCLLQQAIREEAERQNNTMEEIMLSGRKVPYVDMQRTRRQMTIIDHITLDIFGVIETVEQDI
jgi:hypothetical protein